MKRQKDPNKQTDRHWKRDKRIEREGQRDTYKKIDRQKGRDIQTVRETNKERD